MTMDFATFWQANASAFFDNALAYCIRYQGTLADFEAQRAIIEQAAQTHMARHGAALIDIAAYEGDGSFVVYAWGQVR